MQTLPHTKEALSDGSDLHGLDQIEIAMLPKGAQRLVELIGVPATLHLIKCHGGKRIRLFRRGDSVARLTDVIGAEAAKSLVAHFGCDPIEVPRCTNIFRARRNAKIKADFDRLTLVEKYNFTSAVNCIVNTFNITDRHVSRILKEPTPMPDSMLGKTNRQNI